MKTYPDFGTAPIRCGRTACKWRGFETDLKKLPASGRIGSISMTKSVCPTCDSGSYMFMTPGEIKAWERKKLATAAKPASA